MLTGRTRRCYQKPQAEHRGDKQCRERSPEETLGRQRRSWIETDDAQIRAVLRTVEAIATPAEHRVGPVAERA